jgi:hypothetical protein
VPPISAPNTAPDIPAHTPAIKPRNTLTLLFVFNFAPFGDCFYAGACQSRECYGTCLGLGMGQFAARQYVAPPSGNDGAGYGVRKAGLQLTPAPYRPFVGFSQRSPGIATGAPTGMWVRSRLCRRPQRYRRARLGDRGRTIQECGFTSVRPE